MEYWPLYVSLLILAAALALVLWDRITLHRMMKRMDTMLSMAMDGTFQEKRFDESRLSALETRLANFLSGSVLSARNQAAEKETIKELISDISHQTKTPVANLVLYTQLLDEHVWHFVRLKHMRKLIIFICMQRHTLFDMLF